MVIQRIQTLFLLLAAILMGVLCFAVPIAIIKEPMESARALYLADNPTLFTINALVAVLLFIAIFLFKNLRLQMRITLLCALLLIAALGIGAFVLTCRMPEAAEITWALALLMLLCALILTVAAYSRMKHDRKILRSYDSLR